MSGYAITIKASTNEVDAIRWSDDHDIEFDLLRKAVDGHLEAIHFELHPENRDPFEVIMWVNEEGKLRGLPHNEIATVIYTSIFDTNERIVGDVIITGGEDEEGYAQGIDQDYAFEWAETLADLGRGLRS